MPVCKFSKLTCGISCLIILGCLLVVLAFVLPILIEKIIKEKAQEQILMQDNNMELWGIIPGQSQVSLHRQYYLYNLTNPDDFLYNNAKPEFVEMGPYDYDEHQNYTNHTYFTKPNSSLEEVHYNFWQWYTYKAGNPQDTVNSLNLGSLGVWYQAKNVQKHSMALQLFSNLILGLEDEMMTVGLAQGIQQFIKDQKTVTTTIFIPSRIPEELYDVLWNDEEYGWKNWTSMKVWVKAVDGGIYSGASLLIKEHFHLSTANMYAMLTGPLTNWISTTKSMIQNWYCKNNTNCDTRYLAALQLTQQGMTMNPPPGSAVTESIMTTNDSLRSPPEMSLFLNKVFLKTQGINISAYANVTFSVDWAYRLFNHSYSPDEWLTDYDLLLHIGNLDFIFQIGAKFDISHNLEDFEPMRSRFHLETLEQTHVFYSYLNYMVEEFATQKSSNGTSGEAFMGTIISLEMQNSFNVLNDYLLPELLSNLLLFNLQKNNITCEILFNISGFNQSFSQQICSQNTIFHDENWFNDSQAMKFLLAACENREGVAGVNLRSATGMSKVDLMILCEAENPENASLPFLMTSVESRIHSFYNCTSNNFSCTKNEIARRQWGNSSITLNPLPELSDKYKSSLSVIEWNSTLFPKSFEYVSVQTNHLNFTTNNNIQGFNESISRKLLSYDKLFSQSIRYVFTDYKNDGHQRILESFYAEDSKALQNYLKYIMIEFGLQGLTKTRTVQELLFGYQDPLITVASTTNPSAGGDPSLNPIIALVTNSTYEQAINFSQSVYTGRGDISKTRVYASVYGYEYSNFKDAAFDGNKTFDVYTNPWKEQVKLEGTDSFCNQPDLNTDSHIQIYMTDVCYGGPADYSEQIDHNGLNTLRFETKRGFMQNKTNDPIFDKFYMDKWNQALNATTIKKMPVFLTKFRYLDLDEEPIKDLIIYTNANKTERLKADPTYQIHVDVEPYTGGAVSASLNIGTSFEYQSDELFSNDKYVFLPVLGIIRPGTWSDSAINSIYGDLMLALKLKKITFIVGLAAGLVFILIGVAVLIVRWKMHSKRKTDTLLEKNIKDTDIETNKEEDICKSTIVLDK